MGPPAVVIGSSLVVFDPAPLPFSGEFQYMAHFCYILDSGSLEDSSIWIEMVLETDPIHPRGLQPP